MIITMHQRYIASLCVCYFDELYSQCSPAEQMFINNEWYAACVLEDSTRPSISVDMFLKKYKLRMKLVRP